MADSRAHMWGIAESHLNRSQLAALEAKGLSGRHVYGAAARDLGKGQCPAGMAKSTHGGVLALPDTSLAPYTVAGVRGSQGRCDPCGVGDQWLAVETRAMPTLMLVVAYLDDTVGANATNLGRLYAIIGHARARHKMLVAAADWNMTPEQLQSTGILEAAGLDVVVPEDVDQTCTSGRLLDYFLVSRALRPAILSCRSLPVRWRRHCGILLEMNTDLKEFPYMAVQKPRLFDCYKLQHVTGQQWIEAKEEAESFLAGRGGQVPGMKIGDSQNPIIQELYGTEEAQELSTSFYKWARAMETLLITSNGIPEKEQRRYRGRAQHVVLNMKTLADSRRPADVRDEVLHLDTLTTITAQVALARTQVLKTSTVIGVKNSSHADYVISHAGQLEELELPNDMGSDLSQTCTMIRSLNVEEISHLVARLQKAGLLLARIASREARRTFREWLEGALMRGAKKAHAWTKQDDAGPRATLTFENGPPLVAIKEQAKEMNTLWGRDSEGFIGTAGRIKTIVDNAKQQKKDLIPWDGFLAGISSLDGASGRGMDFVENILVKEAPEKAKKEYLNLMHQIQMQVAWPLQIYINMVIFQAKPQGGKRAIGLMCGLYRQMGRCLRPSILAWRKSKAAFWDAAVSGNSALRAAILRLAQAEIFKSKGWLVVSLFGDYKSFYDNLDWGIVMSMALTLDYPLEPLALGLQLHMAPRMLCLDGAVSEPIMPSNGALAGCWQATEWARVALFGILDHLQARCRPKQLGQFVDDAVLGHAGPDEEEVMEKMVKIADEFQHLSQTHKFPFSPGKVVVVASSFGAAKEVVKRLRQMGIHDFEAVQKTKDLGLDYSAAARRTVVTRNSRLVKSRRRLQRIHGLTKVDRRATKLITAGAMPLGLYGASATGLPIAVLMEYRSAVAQATGISMISACVSTRLALSIGTMKEPHHHYIQQLLGDFFQMWDDAGPAMRVDIRRQWEEVRKAATRNPRDKWRGVTGIIGATVCSLIEVGWTPLTPTTFRDMVGGRWEAPDDWLDRRGHILGKIRPLVDAVQASLEDLQWFMASKGHAGVGLHSLACPSPDLGVARKLLRWLKRQGLDDQAGMLQTIFCGGFWAPSRRKVILPEVDRADPILCPHGCGCPWPDDLHVFWTCAKLGDMCQACVASTQHLVPKAVEGCANGTECLWLRGILPGRFTNVDPRHQLDTTFAGHLGEGFAMFTDASGGEHGRDPRIRQTTWGFVATSWHEGPQSSSDHRVDFSTEMADVWDWMVAKAASLVEVMVAAQSPPFALKIWGGAAGHLEGHQTVPRGELRAIIEAVRFCEELPRALVIYTDHQNHVNTWHRGRDATLNCQFGDLWEEFWALADARGQPITLIHVLAHRDRELKSDLELGRSPVEYIGNALADAAAGFLAPQAVHPRAGDVQLADSLCWRVARRLAVIGLAASGQARSRVPTKGKAARRDITAILRDSKHVWAKMGSQFHCQDCGARATRSQLTRQEAVPCAADRGVMMAEGMGRHIYRPPPASTTAGQQWFAAAGVHRSHLRMGRFGTTIACWDCGCYSASARKGGLKGPCAGRLEGTKPTSEAKTNVLKRLSLGQAPTSGHDNGREADHRASLSRMASSGVLPTARVTPSQGAEDSPMAPTDSHEDGRQMDSAVAFDQHLAQRQQVAVVSEEPYPWAWEELTGPDEDCIFAANLPSEDEFEEEDVFGHGWCLD